MSAQHRTRRGVGWWVALASLCLAPFAGAGLGLAFPPHAPTTCTPSTTTE